MATSIPTEDRFRLAMNVHGFPRQNATLPNGAFSEVIQEPLPSKPTIALRVTMRFTKTMYWTESPRKIRRKEHFNISICVLLKRPLFKPKPLTLWCVHVPTHISHRVHSMHIRQHALSVCTFFSESQSLLSARIEGHYLRVAL